MLGALGDLDGALAAFERNRYRFRGLLAVEVRPGWQLELSRAHRLMAVVYSAQGEVAAALANARSAAALSGALSPTAPAPEPPLVGRLPADWAETHYENLLLLGWIQREAGDWDSALATLEATRGFAEERIDEHGDTELEHGLDWRHHYAVALSYLGLLAQQQGDHEAALALFLDAYRQCAPQVAGDPTNTNRREELQLIHSRIGWARLELGQNEQAAESFLSARREARTLVALEPANAGWLRELAVAEFGVAAARQAQGRPQAALAPLEASLEISRTLAARSPDTAPVTHDLAWDLLTVGRLRRELGEPELARQSFEEAAALMRSLRGAGSEEAAAAGSPAAEPEDAFFLDHYFLGTEVLVLLELGRVEEARPMVERLHAAGWDDAEFLELAARHGLIEPPSSPDEGEAER